MSLVISVDPGLAPRSCGMAGIHVEGHRRVLRFARVIPLGKDDEVDERLGEVARVVSDELVGASVLVVEDQRGVGFGMARQGNINATSRRLVGLVDMLRGIALVTGKPFMTITPGQVRARLGLDRGASKQTVWNRACTILRQYPVVTSEHARDAVGIGIAGEMMHRVDSRRSA